jgi:hypothetical protein
MNLGQRLDILVELGDYIRGEDPAWLAARERAYLENPWFTPEFIGLAVRGIGQFLQRDRLEEWIAPYELPGNGYSLNQSSDNERLLNIGLVMAGNIPLVGFHDFLCIFISGHRQTIKVSSRDQALIRRLVEQLAIYAPETSSLVAFADRLNGCDAFIATGSNNSARYFDYYFAKYPHIIRRNRTSAAVLDGSETRQQLEGLADDVYQYFGLGCRNTTKLYVPENYDFIPLLKAFEKYDHLAMHHKYKNNYDYYLTLLILNKKQYMTNGSILLDQDDSLFSPISVLHYQYYRQLSELLPMLSTDPGIQCIVGQGHIPFGQAQQPGLGDYADGVDTLKFLLSWQDW